MNTGNNRPIRKALRRVSIAKFLIEDMKNQEVTEPSSRIVYQKINEGIETWE